MNTAEVNKKKKHKKKKHNHNNTINHYPDPVKMLVEEFNSKFPNEYKVVRSYINKDKDGTLFLSKTEVVYQSHTLKRAILEALSRYETQERRDWAVVDKPRCYEVIHEDRTICTFGYYKMNSDDTDWLVLNQDLIIERN